MSVIGPAAAGLDESVGVNIKEGRSTADRRLPKLVQRVLRCITNVGSGALGYSIAPIRRACTGLAGVYPPGLFELHAGCLDYVVPALDFLAHVLGGIRRRAAD